ncbi:hypothetical protein ACIBL3_29400 [Kribbella sp. NPDC050124]|uniref:hypothetical protein n=1 Tax=Kribbella sp. NPDC050124 TaxID=3364114 RepID=UPI00379CCD8E
MELSDSTAISLTSTTLFDTTNPILASVGIFALLGTAALTQLFLGRTTPWLGASAGSGALAVGMVIIVSATAVETGVVYLLGSIISGFGFGLSFLGGLRGLFGVAGSPCATAPHAQGCRPALGSVPPVRASYCAWLTTQPGDAVGRTAHWSLGRRMPAAPGCLPVRRTGATRASWRNAETHDQT